MTNFNFQSIDLISGLAWDVYDGHQPEV